MRSATKLLLCVLLFASLTVKAQISVTATLGTPGPTPYTTLNAAFAAINAGTHRGVIQVSVTGNTAEPAMCVLNRSGVGAANYTYVRIKPSAGGPRIIQGSVNNNPLIRIEGSSVSIDGANTVGGTSRDLTLANNSTNNPNVLYFASNGANDVHNDTLKNTIVTNGVNTGDAVLACNTGGNNGRFYNIAVENNSIQRANIAISMLAANAGSWGNGCVVRGNDMNSGGANRIRSTGVYWRNLDNTGGGIFNNNMADFTVGNVEKVGVWIESSDNTTVSGNIMSNFSTNFTSAGINIGASGVFIDGTCSNIIVDANTITGITELGREVASGITVFGTASNINISRNNIGQIENSNSNGNAANGILLNNTGAGATNINIYNNFVYGILSYGSIATLGALQNGFGIVIRAGSGYKIYHNTVLMTGGQVVGISGAMFMNNAGVGGVDLRDNIFGNLQTTPGTDRYAIVANDPANRFSNIDYNDYYSLDKLGYILGNVCNNMGQIQTFFGGNINSINFQALLMSTTDLHLQAVVANNPLNAGWFTTAPSITTDIDGHTRTNPTMGADELFICTPPAAISGPTVVCPGATITLSNTAPGTWSSSATSIATVVAGPATGTTVTGVASAGGNAVITYTIGPACFVTHTVTVTPRPPAVTGTMSVCVGSTTQLSNSIAGTWTSLAPAVATVTPGGGLVYGVSAANAPILFTSSTTGCAITATVTVNPLPATIAGSLFVCPGNTTTLSSSPGGGVWSSATSAVATVAPGAGLVSGVATAGGTSVITYRLGTTCSESATVTVHPVPSAIVGTFTVCAGSTTQLSNTVAGTWISASPGIATINSATGLAGGVAAGTSVITFTSSATGCITTTTLTVLGLPGAITGPTTVCQTASITLSNAVLGGTWSSGNPAIATVTSGGGVVGGGAPGLVVITYSNGCASPTFTVSVAAVPVGIAGPTDVCVGNTIALTNTAGVGTWSSSNSTVATVSGTGIVSGANPGTTIISYANGCGIPAGLLITVNQIPATISGVTSICFGGSTALSNDGSPTGTWTSSNPAIATISPSGVVTSSAAAAGGTTVITAANVCGSITTTVSVGAAPIISGVTTFCQNGSTTLSSPLGAGTWSSSNVFVATTTSTGPVGVIFGTGYAFPPGNSVITHTTPAGCIATVTITTTPSPQPITGIFSVCVGNTTYLTDNLAGGVWTSTNPGVATVGLGDVHGVSAGTTVISYAVGICAATASVVVNALPSAITGPSSVCQGATITLSNASSTVSWSSSNNTVAAIDPVTGVVTGLAPGTSVITATQPAGCSISTTITVNPAPAAITGNMVVCAGQSSILSNTISGGTWTTSNPAVASITPAGVVSGLTAGTTVIDYTILPAGCFSSATFTVNPLPSPIIGPSAMCTGTSATLTTVTAFGTWSSNNTPVATINTATGAVDAGIAGTAVITYLLTTGCSTTFTITVNQTPPAITGTFGVCVGSITNISNSLAGGTWSNSNPAAATITPAGQVTGVSAGTTVIDYTRAGCSVNTTVTVHPLPATIVGPTAVCVGSTIALTSASGAGTWSSSNPGIATIGLNSGVLTGGAIPGNVVITYTLGTGCITTVTVTVNALPASISGVNSLCATATTTLSSSPGGGTWSSSNPTIASINSTTGFVTAAANPGGVTVITYVLATSCQTQFSLTVNPIPAPILGPSTVCVGQTIALTNVTAGGTWSSSNIPVASVSATGIVTGGTVVVPTQVIINFTLTTGCAAVKTLTVNPLPTAISGNLFVCSGSSTQLSNGSFGGTWSSSNALVATINTFTGSVLGGTVSSPTQVVITYTLGSGCVQTATLTVNPVPDPITGTTVVCAGSSTQLSDATPGGTWSSANNAIASVSSSGLVTGAGVSVASNTRITYTLSATGCTAITTVSVNPLPALITGGNTLCQGASMQVSDATSGGVWSSSNTDLATISLVGPNVLVNATAPGGATGVDSIIYTLPTGCMQTKTVTINLQPAPILGGPVSICQTASVALSNSTLGGVWSSAANTIASVDASGVVTGGSVGNTTISYTIGTCYAVTGAFVNVQPGAITGNKTVCMGSSTTLSNATPLGAWTTGDPTIAVINAAGVVTTGLPGMTTGVARITYAVGSCISVTSVTVNVQPGPISGVTTFCNTTSTYLSNATLGGVWSSSNANATVNASGLVTGTMALGAPASTATISYTMPVTGCFTVRTVNIKTQPGPIIGPTSVCNGADIQLSNTTAGGVWSAGTGGIISVNTTGKVTGLTAGQDTVVFDRLGCYVTSTITVNPLPSPITGIFFVCQGSSTTLGTLSAGVQWASSNPAVATIGISSGIVHGIAVGTTTITTSYIATSCATTHTLQVIPAPSPITGSASVCQGNTTFLSSTTSGGTWTSSNTNIAVIDPSTAEVTGLNAGTVIITTTLGSGCKAIAPITVYPFSQITGNATVCVGQTSALTNATIGGTWTSSNNTIATVSTGAGLVTGVGAGTAVISYNLPSGCVATMSVVVQSLAAPVTGVTTICDFQATTLSNAIPGGVWSSSNPVVAAIDATGFVTTGSGVIVPTDVVISYTLGCSQTTTITVNPVPGPIFGNANLCLGDVETFSTATSGVTWSSSNAAIVSINPTTGVATAVGAGSALITTLNPVTGCAFSLVVIVNPLPAPITGPTSVCVGSTIALTSASTGGAWYTSDPTVADVTFGSGIVTGMHLGSAVISYQVATGCINTTTITVNPLPDPITGPSAVCVGSSITLNSTTPGGVWSASNGNATVSATGVVTGVSIGTPVDISYTLPATGCAAMHTVSVFPLPAPITGNFKICKGLTSQLATTSTGGVWSSSNTFVGTVDPATGLVYSDANPPVSVFNIIYTLPTGCATLQTMTVVNAPSPISGAAQVCVGSCTPLSDTTAGGVWTSFDNTVATIDPITGVVCGVSQGFSIITYAMGGGSCYQTHVIIVNPLPAPITGNTEVCAGLTTQLSDATPGGVWSSQNPVIASVVTAGPSAGLVTGGATPGGVTNITYTLPTSCYVTTTFVTHPLPAPITGNTNICVGHSTVLSSSPMPGTWSSGNVAIASVINPSLGVVYGVDFNVPPGAPYGMTNITYTIAATGCIRTTTVAVHPLPAIYTVTGGGSYCSGTGGVHIGLSGSQIGVNYYLYLGSSTPTGPFAGTGGPLDFGLQTAAGVYTVVANNTYTTCSSNMTGSATITVIPSVAPTVDISASPGDTVCSGTPVTFIPVATNEGTGPVYNWSVNGLLMSVGASYTFVPANGDVVSVVLNSNAICAVPATATDAMTMTVYTAATPAVNILISPNDTVCTGSAVTFTAVPFNGGTAPAYQWTVNGLPVATTPAYTYTPSNGDLVYVTLTSNAQCRLANTVQSPVETIVVVSPVIPTVVITASNGSLITAGQSDTLTANVTNGISPTFQWYINGVPVTGATGPTFVIDNARFGDSIGVMVYNHGFCNEQGFSWMYIQVHAVGVNPVITSSDIVVVPNPNKGTFTVKGTLGSIATSEVTLELTNMLGQTVYKGEVKARNGRLDERIQLSGNVANGMYMLNVRSGGEHKVFHIVVEQ